MIVIIVIILIFLSPPGVFRAHNDFEHQTSFKCGDVIVDCRTEYYFSIESDNRDVIWIVGSVEVDNNSKDAIMIGFPSIVLWQDSSWIGHAESYYDQLRKGSIIAAGDKRSFYIYWLMSSKKFNESPKTLRFEYDCEDLQTCDMPENYWMY